VFLKCVKVCMSWIKAAITLDVSDDLCVHHEEFKSVHSIRYMSYRLDDCLLAATRCSISWPLSSSPIHSPMNVKFVT